MTTSPEGKSLVRRRHYARLALLKKRTTIASLLGFAALFGLVTQHAAKGSAAGAAAARHSSRSATGATSFFDAKAGGFAFDEGSGSIQSSPTTTASQPPPVAQSSVS